MSESSDASSQFRLGILGAANIAAKIVQASKKAKLIRVVSVGSRDEAKANKFIEDTQCEGAKGYGSYDAVLADGNVDGVYIPLPTMLHVPWVTKAVEAGKHILLEKPVAVNDADLGAILQASKGKVVMIDGTMFMHNPRLRAMRDVIDGQTGFGKLRRVRSIFNWNNNEEFFTTDIRVKPDGDPLGALGDLGWYCIRATLWAFGELPHAVEGGKVNRNADGIILDCAAKLFFSDDRVAEFECSFRGTSAQQQLEIIGSEGAIALDDFVLHETDDASTFRIHDVDAAGVLGAVRETRSVATSMPQESYMLDNFVNLCKNFSAQDDASEPWRRFTHNTQYVLNKVDDALKAGTTVEVPQTPPMAAFV